MFKFFRKNEPVRKTEKQELKKNSDTRCYYYGW